MNKNTIKGLFAFFGMFALILDGKTAVSGAKEGIELCLRTVIPSLFPFFVLSSMVTSSLNHSPFWLRPITRFCRIPPGAESILISGFLGGYPVGAQCIAEFYRMRLLSRRNAQRLLAFCSNAGPAFLFGMIAPLFSHKWAAWVLWGIHIAGALLSSCFFPTDSAPAVHISKEPLTLTAALNNAIRTTSIVCGWVILFRIILSFFRRWFLWKLPITAQVTIFGILELTNGCCELSSIPSESVRFVLCSVFLGFGGFCVSMQTAAVAEGLSIHNYLYGKLLQAFFSFIFSLLFVSGQGLLCPLVICVVVFLSRKPEKSVAIRRELMYNGPRI